MVGKMQHDQRKHQNDSQKSVRNDRCTCPLEVNFSLQTPLEFPKPMSPQPLRNFQFPPWWGSGYFLETHIEYTGEAHYVSTEQKEISQISNKNKGDYTWLKRHD